MVKFEKNKNSPPEVKIEKEKLPKMEITFCYSPHWSEKDAELLKKCLEGVDIFCPEIVGWQPEDAEILNKISQGDEETFITYLTANPRAFWKSIYQSIYNSQKIIRPLDIQESELSKDLKDIFEVDLTANRRFCAGKLKEAIEIKKEFIKKDADLQKAREEIISENIKKMSDEICTEYPQFKNKKKLKILATFGTLHTWLYQETKKSGSFPTREVLSRKPYIYSPANQAVRSQRFVSEFDFNDEYIARMFIEDYISQYFERFSTDTAANEEAARIIASKVNFELIGKISAGIETRPLASSDKFKYIADFLRENKIAVPENKKEFDKLIEDYEKEKFGISSQDSVTTV